MFALFDGANQLPAQLEKQLGYIRTKGVRRAGQAGNGRNDDSAFYPRDL
jgi:hypothetical protein